MALVDTALATLHPLIGALWVGSVGFFAVVVLPAARAGELNAAPLETMVHSLTRGSRVAAVVMVLLWLGLTGLVEVGGSRLRDGVERKKVRQPADAALTVYRGAAAVGALLFVTAGAIAT